MKDAVLAAKESLEQAMAHLDDGGLEFSMRYAIEAAARILELKDPRQGYKRRLELVDGKWYSLVRNWDMRKTAEP